MTPEELANAVAAALRTALPTVPSDRITAASFVLITPAGLKTIRVTVVPESFQHTPNDRDGDAQETTVTINVQVAADPSSAAKYAPALDLANAIVALFSAGGSMRDADVGDATFERLERNPLLRPDHLYELNIATAPISVTYSHD